MARGRLIFPVVAEIAQLDFTTTAADPDGTGVLTSGYDEDFRDVVHLETGISARVEKEHIFINCQLETEKTENLDQKASGDVPGMMLRAVFHFRDLESAGLVDATTGAPDIRKGDRLVSIREKGSLSVIRTFDGTTSPQLFLTHPLEQSFGLTGAQRNLLTATFESRDRGYMGAV